LTRFCHVCQTHNPLVAGSSPARPTKFRLLNGLPGRFCVAGVAVLPAIYRRLAGIQAPVALSRRGNAGVSGVGGGTKAELRGECCAAARLGGRFAAPPGDDQAAPVEERRIFESALRARHRPGVRGDRARDRRAGRRRSADADSARQQRNWRPPRAAERSGGKRRMTSVVGVNVPSLGEQAITAASAAQQPRQQIRSRCPGLRHAARRDTGQDAIALRGGDDRRPHRGPDHLPVMLPQSGDPARA
jgi:hypothetical protein